ncbi:tRNA (adenosine(37)-N6)-threonylcarbamoyltransferase complex ATPase subunit type 1 TsaE [Geomonas sp. RF6]|uniref:tRNA (adenosine(37)-N6)-threonylcarbamoyltransferase complex ATPase subunit type 1 TsaE n=1 Tax=Geomonas sp. RF6 TaxID=2897342 RepID=UPI001E4EB4B8|nr:tRNA (adenosine(37)-N6)-threonylcarbamoyltransferase complex ATPase subunit type 1 TsaE [Geomonas sp. RF6]UFS70888.1 tRNA (adenosine(37)-N6)-threonylcarbamoyltransferase complex ATPase subunit type 1 TsaE [Geomonas sp. RF6]
MRDAVTIATRAPLETEQLGRRVGRLLAPGDFLALTGELGAGKTRFAKGVAEGLGVAEDTPVTSPTYTILNIYEGRIPLYHFDLYRLRGAEEVEELGFEEYFYGRGVSLVEWAERLEGELPADLLTVTCRHLGDEEREFTFAASGVRSGSLLAELEAALQEI